jgi:hypothetical protein
MTTGPRLSPATIRQIEFELEKGRARHGDAP